MLQRLLITGLVLGSLTGCSVYMAASGEEKRDLNILRAGTERDLIVSEFGAPVSAVDRVATRPEPVLASAGVADVPGLAPALSVPAETLERYDLFTFVQGRSDASNAGRAVFYGAAAVLTLGLSEVVMTPLEYVAGDNGEIKLRTHYDADWRLTKAEVLDGADWVSVPEFRERVAARQRAAEQEAAKPRQ